MFRNMKHQLEYLLHLDSKQFCLVETMCPVRYRYDGDDQDDDDEIPPVHRKRRKRQSESGIMPVLSPDVLEVPIQPLATVKQSQATAG